MSNIFSENRDATAAEHLCPLCGFATGINLLCKVDSFSIYACSRCGADHVYPSPDPVTLKDYYNRNEWFEGGEKGGYSDYDAQTAWSLDLMSSLLAPFGDQQGLSILDVGCGYGTHLNYAAERGWKCFGVELSDHARSIAQTRLGHRAQVVESVADLIPHNFDLILMFDVIEHLPSPYTLFFSLFSIGAITPKTQLVIVTPNAGSDEALRDPGGWVYRHPPSHLVYYSAKTLRFLLERLHFSQVEIRGLHPVEPNSQQEASFSGFGGLLAIASGSDFTEFMRERYVPGTWSKIAEYEHLPRYALAKIFAQGKSTLDFGCGTGYGSAILAESASKVIGLDIDQKAIDWATQTHSNDHLHFHRCDDLGSTLEAKSFDVVTCFEMIEHVNHETQKKVIASIARLLREDGQLIISTPNPEVTKLYGENPYHLREMTESEFLQLLREHFAHVRILQQRIYNSVAFDGLTSNKVLHSAPLQQNCRGERGKPLAFIAICSQVPISEIPELVFFDENTDFTLDFMTHVNKLHQRQYESYRLLEQVRLREQQISAYQSQANEFQQQISAYQSQAIEFDKQLRHANAQLNTLNEELKDLQRIRTEELGSLRSLLRNLFQLILSRTVGLIGHRG